MSLTTAPETTFDLDTLSSGEVPVLNLSSVDAVKQAAAQELASLPFPTTRDEEWRFTNIKPIARSSFKKARSAGL